MLNVERPTTIELDLDASTLRMGLVPTVPNVRIPAVHFRAASNPVFNDNVTTTLQPSTSATIHPTAQLDHRPIDVLLADLETGLLDLDTLTQILMRRNMETNPSGVQRAVLDGFDIHELLDDNLDTIDFDSFM